jgi:hypothetical protein
MKPTLLLIFLSVFSCLNTWATRIGGTITDDKGQLLPYASIIVKGTTRGTTANNEGKFFINLDPGEYTIICQYVGYNRVEKKISVTDQTVQVDFQLSLQQLSLAEVVVKPGAEDPAYEIIRNAIRKRTFYLNQIDKFQSEVYIKGQLRLRDYPKKIFGQKVDFEDGDTSKKKIVYLSETIARYSVDKPNKTKVEVLSTKVSGNSNDFGFSSPQIVSFYTNIIQVGQNLNPRGFVSPIADNALNFYRYKLEGVFFEDGKEINRIKVTPKRKYEPLFSGYINITENDWRIHSVQLQLTKESQMEFVDTLRLEQLYVPYDNDIWVIKTQVIYLAAKIFGFDAYGSFVNIYSKFDVNPGFTPRFFNNTVMKFNEGSNKKPADYWDTIRPVPLQQEELLDYQKKDSLEQVRKDPRYLDSLDRRRNKFTPFGLVLTGQSFSNTKKRETYSISPLLRAVGYNTAEGWTLNLRGSWQKRLDSTGFRHNISVTPVLRYGFSNHHFNAYAIVNYNYGKKYFSGLTASGGKRVYQFNNANPIADLNNVLTTLYWEKNHMKTYEAWFGRLSYTKGIGDGFNLSGNLVYQDRMPLENTTNYKWRDIKGREYTPNYPEIMNRNIDRYQALVLTVGVSWRPGARYIEFPDRKIGIGSRYPTFSASITQGIKDVLGSDISYTKWRFGIQDNLNLKLKGTFRYHLSIGGFLNTDSVAVPDYQHFNGNQILTAGEYLNTFQLLPYYKYSNKETFYAMGHAEHHFNGMLTNKIPLFRKLNWHLVGGSNAFFVNRKSYYIEAFAGLENIFKIIRVDLIWGFEPSRSTTGVRIGILGFGGRDND